MYRWERRQAKRMADKRRISKSGASARILQQIIVQRAEALRKGERNVSKTQGNLRQIRKRTWV